MTDQYTLLLLVSIINVNVFRSFQAMAKDKKNIWQETPKQIRQKVLKFVSIPEQFAVYAKERGLLESENTNSE